MVIATTLITAPTGKRAAHRRLYAQPNPMTPRTVHTHIKTEGGINMATLCCRIALKATKSADGIFKQVSGKAFIAQY
jgi:hypothetical protein